MCRIIDRLANEKGFALEDANYVFNFVTARLIDKVPSLRNVIEDVFEELDDKFRDDVDELATINQQQHADRFKAWRMPNGSTIRPAGCNYIL